MMLELASTSDLLTELTKRYLAFVAVGFHLDDPTTQTKVMEGPAAMCAGLLHEAQCEITAAMAMPPPSEGQEL